MKANLDFFKHPISGLALVAVIAVVLMFTITPNGNSLNALDPGDYYVIDGHEHISSMEEADLLIDVMDAANVAKTVIVGSPNELLNYQGEKGFSGFEENNQEILDIATKYDKRFYAFCTIDPDDSDKLDMFQDCITDGGYGLKLYNGHSFFYEDPLDDDKMLPVYRYAEENQIPVIMHVNTAYYLDQFENVLTLYPDMTVICSHFCLSSKKPSQIASLLSEHENLYIDISFGYREYLQDGLTRISDNIEVFKELFNTYPDRFLYGTTAVITPYEDDKTEDWLIATYQTYRDLLQADTYTTFHLTDEVLGEEIPLNGLALTDENLKKIYYENWEQILID